MQQASALNSSKTDISKCNYCSVCFCVQSLFTVLLQKYDNRALNYNNMGFLKKKCYTINEKKERKRTKNLTK